jgi:hypothetical protein
METPTQTLRHTCLTHLVHWNAENHRQRKDLSDLERLIQAKADSASYRLLRLLHPCFLRILPSRKTQTNTFIDELLHYPYRPPFQPFQAYHLPFQLNTNSPLVFLMIHLPTSLTRHVR